MYVQYFHPDNMTSAEKMKLELKKVRDEFKMSESDCGSARVQGKISSESALIEDSLFLLLMSICLFCLKKMIIRLFYFSQKNFHFPFFVE